MSSTTTPPDTLTEDERAILALYEQMIKGWNERDADTCAAPFAEDSDIIGFDGSQHQGRAGFASDLRNIFDSHDTGAFVTKIRGVRFLTPEVAVLRAVSSVVPPGQSDLRPDTNALQSLIAVKKDGRWQIAVFQNTPAQFHGRPELREQLSEELRQLL